MSRAVSSPPYQRLLDAAARLFYANGTVATGIDAITAEAGVAKMTLYNNFASKDALVQKYVEARHAEWLELYRARAKGLDSAKGGVTAVFDAYVDHAGAEYIHGFRGCGLLNAAAEFPAGSPVREAVRQHKEQVESILAGHLANLVDADTAARTAEHLSFLLEGAVSRAGLEGRVDRLEQARHIAGVLVDRL